MICHGLKKVNLKDFTVRGGLPVPRPADKEVISLHRILTKRRMLNKMKYQQLFLVRPQREPLSPGSQGCCCCSVTQSCPTLCHPVDRSRPGFPVLHCLPELAQTIESVMPSNHLILCRPCLLLPSIFPSIRVFSNESFLRIRWQKYWSFDFSHQSFQ